MSTAINNRHLMNNYRNQRRPQLPNRQFVNHQRQNVNTDAKSYHKLIKDQQLNYHRTPSFINRQLSDYSFLTNEITDRNELLRREHQGINYNQEEPEFHIQVDSIDDLERLLNGNIDTFQSQSKKIQIISISTVGHKLRICYRQVAVRLTWLF